MELVKRLSVSCRIHMGMNCYSCRLNEGRKSMKSGRLKFQKCCCKVVVRTAMSVDHSMKTSRLGHLKAGQFPSIKRSILSRIFSADVLMLRYPCFFPDAAIHLLLPSAETEHCPSFFTKKNGSGPSIASNKAIWSQLALPLNPLYNSYAL